MDSLFFKLMRPKKNTALLYWGTPKHINSLIINLNSHHRYLFCRYAQMAHHGLEYKLKSLFVHRTLRSSIR